MKTLLFPLANLKIVSAGILLLALASWLSAAHALCLDPATGGSAYKLPLQAEVQTAEAIFIGRVLSEQLLREDAADPDGYTASNVTIQVLARLKGNPPSVVVVRNENTSSRYPMSTGEKHILFVSHTDRGTWVDNCGNSAVMPAGEKVAAKVRQQLKARN